MLKGMGLLLAEFSLRPNWKAASAAQFGGANRAQMLASSTV